MSTDTQGRHLYDSVTSDEGGNLVATEYKVFISLNGDPKNRGLKRVVPQKYQDVSEEDFETNFSESSRN